MVLAVGVLVKAAGGATWLAVGFAAVGVVGAVIALGFGAAEVRAQRGEARAELWRTDGAPRALKAALAGAGMYRVGVDQEAGEALEAAGLAGTHAPYVHRDVDEALCDRLRGAAEQRETALIVLRGPSKAGKSRTVLEALRAVAQSPAGALAGALADAMLVEPANAAALARLASGGPPPELKAPVPAVVWLDDIEPFITAGGDGLNARVLSEWFSAWARPVLIVATAGGKGRRAAAAGEYADPLEDLLRTHPPLELAAWLSDRERQALAANPAYSQDAALRIGDEGVGEFMVVASAIRERLGDETDCPEGLAVARAAIDWRRLGLIRPISEPALRDLYRAYLPGPPLPGRFDTGITWATEVIYANNIALVRGAGPYEPYDYAARYDADRARPIKPATWDMIIEQYAIPEELSSVGISAVDADLPDRAEAAFRRADERGNGAGAFNLGVLLEQRGDLDDAEAAYRRADERGHGAGAYNLGVLLQQRGDLDDAEAAYRRADERGHGAGAFNLGVLLQQRGDLDDAEAAYRRADERGDGAGAFNLGVLLEQRGDLDDAEAAFRRADERGDGAGAFNLGVLLQQRGDLDDAEAAFRRADERGDGAGAFNLGVLLQQRGDLDDAEAAYRRADERGDGGGASNLGVLLEQRGDLDDAEAAYRRADERGHGAGAYNLGVLLEQRGDLDDAEAAYRRADERGDAQPPSD